MDNIELLFQHYNDTYSITNETLHMRNNLFICLFLTICFLFLFAISPENMSNIVNSFLKENYKLDFTAQISLIQTSLWIILLYLTMRYFQTNIQIERHYAYLSKLENELTKEGLKIDREGNNYLKDYPFICDFIDILYKYFFPLFYIVVIVYKIVKEWKINNEITISLIINSIIFVLSVFLCFLYIVYLIKKKNNQLPQEKITQLNSNTFEINNTNTKTTTITTNKKKKKH